VHQGEYRLEARSEEGAHVMKFGVETPTCTAGMMYPVPFATTDDVVRVAAEAEQPGLPGAAGRRTGGMRRSRLASSTFPASCGSVPRRSAWMPPGA